jgi:hypothetical protein
MKITPFVNNLVHICDTEDSTNGSPVVLECGDGVILNVDELSVVSKSINKVLNCFDRHKPKVQWESNVTAHTVRSANFCVLVTLYYYNNAWRVHTENTPEASETMSNNVTISNAFWELFGSKQLPHDQDKFFIFRMNCYRQHITTKQIELDLIDRHLMSDANNELELLGVIDKTLAQEAPSTPFAQTYNWKQVSEFDLVFDKLHKLQNYCYSLSPLQVSEVWYHDNQLRRVAVLSVQRESLVTLLKSYPDQPSDAEKLMLDVIRSTFHDHSSFEQLETFFHQHYEQLVPLFDKVKERYSQLCTYLDDIYSYASTPIGDQVVDQKLFISRVSSFPLDERFGTEHGKRIRDSVFSVVSLIYKKEHELPTEVTIERVAEFFAYRMTEKGVYPLLYTTFNVTQNQ